MSEMTTPNDARAPRWARRPVPAVVTPLTKVNLALPFSKITVEEPGKDLAELASIVAALAAVMERTVDEPFLPEVRKRAEVLAARLR
jgi:hypothetical protein